MANTLALEERSIKQIYVESREPNTYEIPVYQRNYSWEEDEISELINDVYDFYLKKRAPYYIGTLVTYERADNVYEVIDGQQRLTTIYIILKVLGVKEIKNNLTYRARRVSANTLVILGDKPYDDEVDKGILRGFSFAEKALKNLPKDDIDGFKRYFLDNVHIIHYKVPSDVDLNHYFEVMNSRGEQLEKHEIVKSMLGQHLEEKELSIFCRVWESCSEMNMYIQQVFPEINVFGNNLNKFNAKSFSDIPEQNELDGKVSLQDLLSQTGCIREFVSTKEQNDEFQPIIDFSNFLLIVLKITMMQYKEFNPIEFSLDDKELINEFSDALDSVKKVEKTETFAKTFGFNLLRAKYLLDNYIVHQSLDSQVGKGDNPWKLESYCQEKDKKGYPKNITENLEVQIELVHLLSMFEVSYSSRQRKNYLFYCLKFLFDWQESNVQAYLEFLRKLADRYFYDIYLNATEMIQPGPNAFDEALLSDNELNMECIESKGVDYVEKFRGIYKQGSANIPLFVFNYTDYFLWRFYANEIRGRNTKEESKERVSFFEKLGCGDFGLEPFKNFYFSRTRKSLEHFYPQAKAGDGKALSHEDINCFGNFAMIGAEINSSGSDLDPKAKLDRYGDGKYDQVGVASLKFQIMMQICRDNCKRCLNGELTRDRGMEWNREDMDKHQHSMLSLIFRQKASSDEKNDGHALTFS